MTKGFSQSSCSKPSAMTGYASSVPVKTTVSFKGEGSYETKSRVSYGDKQSGCYGRAMKTEKSSAGEFQWKSGTTGTKSEYKESSTLRVGDKSGYTEIYNEHRVRNLTYDNSKHSLTYNNGAGGGYDSDEGGSDGGDGYDSNEGGSEGGTDYGSDEGCSDDGYSYDSDEGGSYSDDGYDSDY